MEGAIFDEELGGIQHRVDTGVPDQPILRHLRTHPIVAVRFLVGLVTQLERCELQNGMGREFHLVHIMELAEETDLMQGVQRFADFRQFHQGIFQRLTVDIPEIGAVVLLPQRL